MSCPGQCDGCAFRPGTAANLEIDNRLKGALTAMAANAFYCHDTLNWKLPVREAVVPRGRPEVMRAALVSITLPGMKPRVCAGWKAAVRELASKGWFRGEAAGVRRHIANLAIAALREVVANSGAGKRATRVRKREMKSLEQFMFMLAEDAKQMQIEPAKVGF